MKARTASAKPSSGPSMAVYSMSWHGGLREQAVDQGRLAVGNGVADDGVAVGHGGVPGLQRLSLKPAVIRSPARLVTSG